MIRLLKLYSEPQLFEPITFEPGVNIILGEKVDSNVVQNRKTNGVGKSICIQFIDFCLLKRKDDSRVMKIPEEIFPGHAEILLDLKIFSDYVTISRTRQKPDNPTVFINNRRIDFSSLKDALDYLGSLFFRDDTGASSLSFRQALAPVIRDERSEFKDIINCFDTEKRIPPLYDPHLYYLKLNVSAYQRAKNKIVEIIKSRNHKRELKKKITNNNTRNIKDVKAELNALSAELDKMAIAIESLKNNQSFETIQKDLVTIENDLDNLRTRQKAIRYELKRIETLPKQESINEDDIELIYNQFKQGLGDMVSKSLTRVKEFKNKIESFQHTLLNEKVVSLTEELDAVTGKIRSLDTEYSEKLKIIDQKGVLKDFKISLRVYDKKNEDFSEMRFLFKNYDAEERKQKELKLEKAQLIMELDDSIEAQRESIEGFNSVISEIHEAVMGNRECSFDIETVDKSTGKKVVEFGLRIYDDGSHSIERTKVFIYDMALMFTESTRQRHPKLLIHDNIFDVDQDTLVRSLNYLARQEEEYNDFQYILTLNRDKIENEERQKLIRLNIEERTRASFSKKSKFLKKDYQELDKS